MAEHEQSSMAGLKKIFIIVLLASFSTGKQDSCKERESCNSKINKYSLKINCGCDKSCVAIGDCCSDYRRHGDMPKPLPTTPDCEPTSLIRSVTIRNGNMIPIVKKCPTDFMNTYIKQRCEMQEKLLPITATKIATNFTLLVPVFGKSSSVLFANVYCAICNGEKETAFLDVDFQNYSPLQFEKLVHMKDLNRFHTVFPRTRVTMSHADYMPRPCLSSKETCAETWPEDEVKSLCQNSATSLVYTRSNVTTYKNRYCAKCNYVDDINLTCNNPKRHLGSGPPPWSMFPYSLLFDLNTGMTVSRRQLRSTNSMEVISMHKRERDCDTNELYDPFHRNCIDLYCPEGRDVCMHQKDVDGKDPQDFKGENGGLSVSANGTLCDMPLELLHKLSLHNSSVNHLSNDNLSWNVIDKAILCTANNSWNGSPNALPLDQVYVTYLGYPDPASYLTVVCNALSIAGLTAHLVIYGMFQSLRNTPGKCLMCLSFCLLMTQLLFTLAIGHTSIRLLCFATALTLHYITIAYFLWMTVLSFDIWHTFHMHARSPAFVSRDSETTFQKYCLFAFGVPVLLVTASAVVDSFDFKIRPHYAEYACWFGQQTGLIYYFDVPVAVTICINTTFLLLTIRNIINVSRTTEVARSQSSRKEKHRFFLYVKLSLVMGLTYVTAFIAMATKRPEVWYIFIIFNALQGVWIFLSFVCTRKVFKLICESCGDRMGIKPISERSRSKNSCSTTKQTALLDSATINETDKLTIAKEEEVSKR